MPRVWLAIFALVVVLLPNAAHAACGTFDVPDSHTSPATSPMASGGTITVTLGDLCDTYGLNPYPHGSTTFPQHGAVSVNSNAGIITYTNNGDGALTDTFIVEDASAHSFTVNVAIAAATSPITVSPSSLPTPNVGTSYNQTLSASGGTAPYGFSLTGGSLPPGLSFTGTTISGTPNQAGSYSATFTVTDNASLTATKSYTLIVPNPSSGITIAAPPNANLNTFYSHALSASGALAPYTFSIQSGALPPGLSLAGGVISGTPTAANTYAFTLLVTDSSPNLGGSSPGPYFKVISTAITVQNVPPVANLVSATVGYGSGANPITLNITGGAATSVAIGTVASHGTATASGTSITYTPTAGYAGPDTFTYTASNGAGTSAAAMVTITVSPPTITYTPANPPAGTVGVAYSQSIAGASGGAAPYTYAVTSGSLPLGLTLDADGTLHGTPTASGSTFSVKATDSSAGGPFSSAPANVTVTINPAAAPTVGAVSATVGYGSGANPITLNITGGAATSVAIAMAASHGMAVPTGTSITYKPNAGYAGPDSFNYTATNASGTSAPATVTITVSPPTITYSPANPPAGTVGAAYSQSIAGASGGAASYTYALASGTLPANITLSGNGTLSGTPTTAGTYSFTVTAKDSSTGPAAPFSSAPANVTVTINPVAAPTVASVAPNSGSTAGGTAVTITGTNFAGATAVTFDGAAATSFTVVNGTTINATTPAHAAAGAVAVAVTAPGGNASLPNGFTYVAPAPTVSGVAPNSGSTAGGTAVTITSTNFIGATAVTFDGAAATSFTVVSGTTINATTPAHTAAGAVAVAVTAPGGNASLPNGFTYAVPAPTISGVTPNSGSTAGGTAVTITGTGFTGATAVTFAGAAATSFTVVSGTTINATTPAHTAAGAVAVAVTAPGGNASLPNGFTYAVPAPTISGVTPNSGSTAGGTAVTITGTGFTGATAVTFAGAAATSFTVVSGTTINAATPARTTAGAVAIAVTAPGGNANLPNGFTYSAPLPTVTSHTLQLTAGASGTVNLTQGATGGPFTAATVAPHRRPQTARRASCRTARSGSLSMLRRSRLLRPSSSAIRFRMHRARPRPAR
ncbi:IPT/TIG domain-containing protein [Nitrobacter hamburgensis]|uniref:IPT/TIG domain-containing protein n=1 Tax=Nitrobacter hamburgensis TaxID=912 RepID=UPI000674239A|nr:IPT/TIG domain-containing protein [Nitrobacter hamburgensis]